MNIADLQKTLETTFSQLHQARKTIEALQHELAVVRAERNALKASLRSGDEGQDAGVSTIEVNP
jgi:outer membrane protein TolC